MNKLLIILFVLISINLRATTYYVSPTGNDSNPGTITEPWATWGKAFNSVAVQPGDTVYFRGGVYQKNLNDGNIYYPGRARNGTGWDITRDGTVIDTIKYWAYPGEKPILDCSEAYDPDERLVYGIRCSSNVDYVWFKGLTIRNVKQNPIFPGDESGFDASQVWAWKMAGNYIIENCVVHNIGGFGFELGGTSSPNYAYVINCDAYDCCDSITTVLPGNDGYGFSSYEAGGQVYYKNCRAWRCGDYGFQAGIKYSFASDQNVIYDGCWSFCNGLLEGGGMGFTMGWIAYTDGEIKRTYKNCISAYNRQCGWKTLDYKYPHAVYGNIYNCIGYHNGYQDNPMGGPAGYFIELDRAKGDVNRETTELLRTLRNNISYDNENGNVWTELSGALYTHSNNSWDIPLTLQPSDFVSLDSTGLTGARQADGSLPVLNFLKLSSTSAAIDAGTDVGLDYNNAAPDLGAYEYPTFEEGVVPYLNTTYPTFSWSMGITSGGNMLDAGGGTISRKGVCYSTSVDPTTSDNVVEGGTGTSDFTSKIWALKPNTTYHVRAFATNEYGTGYGADVTFTTPARSFVMKNKKVIKLNGKIVII